MLFTSIKRTIGYLIATGRCQVQLSRSVYLNKLKLRCSKVNSNETPDSVSEKRNKSGIMRVLHVAEKNDAAKRISNLLSNGTVQTRNGCSVYNKNYEFTYNFRNQRCEMTMTSVSGHLLTQEFDNAFRKWNSCDPVELFDAPVLKVCQDNMKEIKRNLEQKAAYCSVLIIWTDCDREGENIGYEVISVCKNVNPRLEVLRAKFSEITKQAISRAINALIQPDKRVSDAVDVRSELDLRIGAAFTRFQTLRLTRKFPAALADRLISYGSCQFPTLGFVVERYKAIQDFVREDFWKIEVTDKRDNDVVSFAWARHRLFDRLAVQSIYEMCLDDPQARVIKVQSKPKSKWRPVALDTVEFEKLASRKLRIGAKEAMKIAEQLYTSGFISYPRTETNIFPPGLDLASLVEQQTESNQWGAFATRLLNQGVNPRNGKKSDQAHPPIHPTKFDTLASHSVNHRKIYELIVRHFLACCSKDALGKETIVEINIADEHFITSGLTVIERNYLEVYIYDKWSDKELPDYVQGETFSPTKIEIINSQTSPPNLLTEADLIALMEKHGIGTDATHAEHIETIKQRQYVGLQGIHFVPGKLGMGLVEGYDAMGFEMSKPNLRAELEADLQKICEGRKQPGVVLQEQIRKYKEVFVQTMDQVTRLDEALGRLLTDVDNGERPRPPPPPNNTTVPLRTNNRDPGQFRNQPSVVQSHSGSRNANVPPRNARGGVARPNDTTRNRGNDAQGGGANHNAGFGNRTYDQNRNDDDDGDDDEHRGGGGIPMCGCNQQSASYTVRKEGANQGRKFFGCCIPYSSGEPRCGFFQWDDTPAANTNARSRPNGSRGGYGSNNPGSSRGNNRGRGRGSSAGTGGRRARRCGLCHQEGHTRRNCHLAGEGDDDEEMDYS